ncbi:MAG: hypothetical protein GY805_11315 [Chloroflexi bacterium]|nr:hypothetical protein [Chloroflexota bacterium]
MLAKYDESAIVQLDDAYQLFRKNGALGIFQPVLDAQKAFVQLNLDNDAHAISWADNSGFTVDDRPLYQNHSLYQIYITVRLRQYYVVNDKDELLHLLPMTRLYPFQVV